MGPVRSDTDDRVVPLDAGWMLAVLDPGAAETPADADARGDWIDALVPGTAEAALIAVGRLAPGAPSGLHDRDVWYRCMFTADGPATLRFGFDEGGDIVSMRPSALPTAPMRAKNASRAKS